jgi:hypothetical protein
MLAAALLSIALLAQGSPVDVTTTAPVQPAAQPQPPLDSGACLDAPRPVPRVLQPPIERGMQIVRIDKVESTATMMPAELIGFLYTLEDGTTWLGQRTSDYMSPAAARAINRVLASTHLPGENVTRFPPQTRYGVATRYQQFFKVQIPAAALGPLRIRLEPCVVWPAGRPLPDPSM